MTTQSFIKMHGIGNDFVIIDTRLKRIDLNRRQVCALTDRHIGIGCDQLILLEKPQDKHADAFMRIYNADGSSAEACGNGARCVASILLSENHDNHAIIETNSGLLDVHSTDDNLFSVDMGPANLDWRDIPLKKAMDTINLSIGSGPLQDPVGVNIGNPHAVFFVDDAENINLAQHGPIMERHKLFPKNANIGVASIKSSNEIRLRVWERGVGETLACGSGACAAVVAANRRSLCGRVASVQLNGGILHINWMADNHLLMTGPVATSFSGIIDLNFLT